MARSRKIKRSRKSKKSSSFLPDSLQAFIARRLVDGVALALFMAAVFVTSSLLSYDSGDPSWNTAAESEGQAVANVGTEPGAFVSDIKNIILTS